MQPLQYQSPGGMYGSGGDRQWMWKPSLHLPHTSALSVLYLRCLLY
jgi:hypothetical protein